MSTWLLAVHEQGSVSSPSLIVGHERWGDVCSPSLLVGRDRWGLLVVHLVFQPEEEVSKWLLAVCEQGPVGSPSLLVGCER